MNATLPPDASPHTPKQQLALNVNAALRVAGPALAGKPNKLRQVDVMRITGMSRTTLRPLLDTDESSLRNPDLTTLNKLANAIGVPLAFLLMTPTDWRVLIKAIGALADYQAAAYGLMSNSHSSSPAIAEAILKRCKVHPERPPLGVDHDPQEIKRIDARNEWRRRCSLVMAALAQPAARGESKSLIDMTALASALANEMTPYSPESDSYSQNKEESKS